jgi:hypothetical protein
MTVLFALLSTSYSRLRDLPSRPADDPLAAYPGKIQFPIFWDKTCPYCEQQLAEVEAANDQWSGMGIVVVANDISDPYQER